MQTTIPGNMSVTGGGPSGSDVPSHRAHHRWAEVMPQAPAARAIDLTQRFFSGGRAHHGRATCPQGAGPRAARDGRTFAMDDALVAAIECGRFKGAPAIGEFNGSQVTFESGSRFDPGSGRIAARPVCKGIAADPRHHGQGLCPYIQRNLEPGAAKS